MGCSGCGKVVGSVVDLGTREMGTYSTDSRTEIMAAIRALEARVAHLEILVAYPMWEIKGAGSARKLRKARASKRTAK